jgi:modification methylase
VAKKLGRTYIGIERDEGYIALARRRLEQVPPYDPESLEVTPSKRAAPRIPFGQVVERGLLDPGQVLFDAKRRFFARVRADGSLVCEGARGSIHKMGAHVQGASACNGWTFWHFDVEGRAVPIDLLRQKLRAETN